MPSNLIFHCNSSAAYDILVTESGELELGPSYVPLELPSEFIGHRASFNGCHRFMAELC